MEHLALEIFDLTGTGSKYAVLEDDATITVTDTSEIFASGDVWSHSFTLNIPANAHIFGTSGDLHGSRLHEQVNKRRARLWVMGLPLYLGYLKLGDEVDVDSDGNVDVSFESGQKTFEEMIEGTNAQEVSVGDVPIGIALNRKRVSHGQAKSGILFEITGLDPYVAKYPDELFGVNTMALSYIIYDGEGTNNIYTPYVQQWPKLVKSHGIAFDENWNRLGEITDETEGRIVDYTNVQHPYDVGHPFCNINICYPMKVRKENEDVTARGYTLRLGHGNPTKKGGDNETRYNNAPNFYLLYFIERLFKDLGIYIEENQAMDVQDLRRVFMLNYGCFYEEIESKDYDSTIHLTPDDLKDRYGQYYLPIVGDLVSFWSSPAGSVRWKGNGSSPGKVLLRDLVIKNSNSGKLLLELGSVESEVDSMVSFNTELYLDRTSEEESHNAYSAYMAYATGENYPNVEISEIVNAMKSMFGVRLLFNNDFSRVRIVLLRNIFNSTEVQHIDCEIEDKDVKVENCIRGFRMTYGKGKDDTNYYYKGFNDVFERDSTTWKDTTDKHDYSQWKLYADYNNIKQNVSAMNKTCYVTPVTGNAFGVKIDEDEQVLFPSLFEYAGFMDAEDGDCSGQSETIAEVQCGASPVVMNDVGIAYASLFSGDLKAPAEQEIITMGRLTKYSGNFYYNHDYPARPYIITAKIDAYMPEGYFIYLADNYSIGNSGTPFDDADPGLQFGVMRGSGYDAFLQVRDDPQDGEGNDTWEIEPGSSPCSYPDSCDCYGSLWRYNDSIAITTESEAYQYIQFAWPDSNVNLSSWGKFQCQSLQEVSDENGAMVKLLFASGKYTYNRHRFDRDCQSYAKKFIGMTRAQMKEFDAGSEGEHWLVEIDSSEVRKEMLVMFYDWLLDWAYYHSDVLPKPSPIYIENGVPVTIGRFSLKLRAEKPNPFYDPKSEDPEKQKKYLEVTTPELRQRGLADQFYKEYSYWVRNARIVKRTVHMELAQLLSIDKTKKVKVGDITGFIRKIQFSISNKTGLGAVTMEIMYI